MKLFLSRPVWEANDAADLRVILANPLGQKMLAMLLDKRPDVTGFDPEQRRIQSDTRSGFEDCITEILHLTQPPK